mmetsp:Transcript_3518/g.8467  ORF Transcript_3518/g.8467 Transcript_3518/m.8467 type:complete len:227 (-) Transcript_3518:494-1174(-)
MLLGLVARLERLPPLVQVQLAVLGELPVGDLVAAHHLVHHGPALLGQLELFASSLALGQLRRSDAVAEQLLFVAQLLLQGADHLRFARLGEVPAPRDLAQVRHQLGPLLLGQLAASLRLRSRPGRARRHAHLAHLALIPLQKARLELGQLLGLAPVARLHVFHALLCLLGGVCGAVLLGAGRRARVGLTAQSRLTFGQCQLTGQTLTLALLPVRAGLRLAPLASPR